MTQQNPGQPYIPPSAASAPGAFNAQQPAQGQYRPGGAPGSYQQAAPQPAPYQQQGQFQPPVAQAPVAQGPQADSFMTNLFDTSRGFVEKFGQTVFYLVVAAIVLGWLYGAYSVGSAHAETVFSSDGDIERDFNWARFMFDMLLNIPWVLAQIGLARLGIELVRATVVRGRAGA